MVMLGIRCNGVISTGGSKLVDVYRLKKQKKFEQDSKLAFMMKNTKIYSRFFIIRKNNFYCTLHFTRIFHILKKINYGMVIEY